MRAGRSRWWYPASASVVAACGVLGAWGSDGSTDRALVAGGCLVLLAGACAIVAMRRDRRA